MIRRILWLLSWHGIHWGGSNTERPGWWLFRGYGKRREWRQPVTWRKR